MLLWSPLDQSICLGNQIKTFEHCIYIPETCKQDIIWLMVATSYISLTLYYPR